MSENLSISKTNMLSLSITGGNVVRIIFIFLISFSLFSCSQKGKITGSIIDGVSTIPIEKAKVSIVATNLSTESNSKGEYYFSGLEYGNYKIKIETKKYSNFIANIIIDKDHKKVYQPTELFVNFPSINYINNEVKSYLLKKIQQKEKWFRYENFKIKKVSNINNTETHVFAYCSFRYDPRKPNLSLWDGMNSYSYSPKIIYKLSTKGWNIVDVRDFK